MKKRILISTGGSGGHVIPATAFYDHLKENFEVHFNENLIMYTIRHYDEDSIAKLLLNKELLLEQKSRHTIHLVVKDIE